MATCQSCECFFPVAQGEDDYEPGKGDCVLQKEDEKGKYWLSKPVSEESECCDLYRKG